MSWVLDASVLIKAVIEETDSELTDRLWASDSRFLAPATAISECANVVVRRVRRRQIGRTEAGEAMRDLARLPVTFLPVFVFNAVSLVESALSLGVSAHDAVYLLLAEDRDGAVVTTDDRMVRAAASSPRWRPRVIALSDWAS